MLNDFSYRLKNKSGAYYSIVNMQLLLSADVVELVNAPSGWMEKSINWKRGKEDFGVIRSFSIPLKFVLDGADIIRFLMYSYGYEADCTLEIMQLNNSTKQYEVMYLGDIDFKTFVDDKDYVSVNTIEGGFQQIVKSQEDIEFEIPIASDPEAISVLMDGVVLTATSEHQTFKDPSLPYEQLTFDSVNKEWRLQNPPKMFIVPITNIGREGTILNIAINDMVYAEDMMFDYGENKFAESSNFFIRCIKKTSLNISGSFSGVVRNEIPFSGNNYEFIIKDHNKQTVATLSKGVGTNQREVQSTSAWTVNEFDFNFNFNLTIQLQQDYKYFLVCRSKGIVINDGSFINISFENRKEKSVAKALLPETVLKRICEKMGGEGILNTLESDPSIKLSVSALSCFTGQNNNSVLKTSLNDFYKFCSSIFGATKYTDENNRLVIGPVKDAFNDEIILNVETVTDVTISVWGEFLFNTIKAGYKNQTYDDINGKLEFNSEQIWKAHVNKVKNELDLMCPYRADGYGIESKRIELSGQTTTDSDSDNDVFILHIEDSPVWDIDEGMFVYKLKRRYNVTSGAAQTSYNVELSPRWNLVRNWPFIKSLLWNVSPLSLDIQSSAKNKDIVIKNGDPVIWDHDEKRSISETSIGNVPFYNPSHPDGSDLPVNPLFIPILIKFKPLVTDNIYATLRRNPRGKVQFNYMGFPFYGYINEINIQPKTEEATNWEVICAPETDLKKLVELISICTNISTSVVRMIDAKINKTYNYVIKLNGSQPFILTSYDLPDGLICDIENDLLLIGGTPTQSGQFMVTFSLQNCAGNKDISIPFNIERYSAITNFTLIENEIASDGKAMLKWQWTNTETHTEVYLYKGESLEPGYPLLLSPVSSGYVTHATTNLENDKQYTLKIRIKEGEYAGQYYEVSAITKPAPGQCVAAGIITINLDPAYVGQMYNQQISLSGTPPFYLYQSNKPYWLSAEISESEIILSGLVPADSEIGFISGVVQNCDNKRHDFYFEFQIIQQ